VAGVRWLSASEQATWRRYLLATNLLDEALDRQLMRDARLAHAHYAVLVALSEAPDRRLRMRELAERVRFSQSRMTHAIASLQRREWVRREPCPTDRRGQVAIITDAGLARLEAAAPGHVSEVRARVFDRLSPAQVAALDDICATLLAGLDPAEAAGARSTD
jgi:DNA-binding MarR family transcriptional regulator